MPAFFSTLDYVAIGFFVLCWSTYSLAMRLSSRRRASLNARMNDYRYLWVEQATLRENRIVDSTINASLQNGTAFFASTSLLAIGGALSLFRVTDDLAPLLGQFPIIGYPTSRLALEFKSLGLAVIFIYSFFKFSWAYRLFNFSAILIGAIPSGNTSDAELKLAALRASRMNVAAGKQFNRGQRAFSFSLAYLGWFISPVIFIIATFAVVIALTLRQYASPELAILQSETSENSHAIFKPEEMQG